MFEALKMYCMIPKSGNFWDADLFFPSFAFTEKCAKNGYLTILKRNARHDCFLMIFQYFNLPFLYVQSC